MPIVTIEVLKTAGDPEIPPQTLQQLTDALGELFQSEAGGTWVKLRYLDSSNYAENQTTLPASTRPVMVEIIHSRLPAELELAVQAAAVCEVVAGHLNQPEQNVHILYQPNARGRIAFGGKLTV